MEYRRLVLSRLRDLSEKVDTLQDSITTLTISVSVLKAKAGAWGAIGGIVFGSLCSWLLDKR